MLAILTLRMGHLEQYCLTNADLPNVVPLHFTISNKSLSLKTPLISEKSKYRYSMADSSFQNFEFLLESSNFILGNKYSQLFAL